MTQSTTSSTPRTKRSLPTPQQAFGGIPFALANAERHLRCADLLAGEGEHGPAAAHLVLAIEETDKARVLGMIWLDEGDLTDDAACKRLFLHPRGRRRGSRRAGPAASCGRRRRKPSASGSACGRPDRLAPIFAISESDPH